MTDQSFRQRTRESAKLTVRRTLQRFDLDVSRGPFVSRLVATLESREISTVLDVGANVGQYATLLRGAGFGGRVISCEPLRGAYAELAGRAARDDGWTALNRAVGARPGTTSINVAGNSYSSSIRPMTRAHVEAAPGSDYVGVEEVDVTTVADLVREHDVDPARTLLKIDTQGYEDEVLAGAGDLVGVFGAVQMELSFVELYEGQRLYDDLVTAMADAGYRIQQLEPGISDVRGRLLQVDGLFVLATAD